MEYIRKDIPLWSITIWDKKFNNVEKEWQPQVKKYKYLLADELDSIRTESGDIRILYTGKDTGFTTEELAGDAIADGEVVTIPGGGIPTVKYHKGKFVTGDNRIATSSDPTLLTNKYLYYFMKGKTKTIASFYRGASLKHPSMRDVLKMNISFPTVDEQNRIVQQFDCLEQLIELRRQELQKLDEFVKSRFFELFGDPIVNEKSWPTESLEDACRVIVDCPHSTPSYTSENTGYMCIRTSIVKKNSINWDEIEYIPGDEYNKRIQRKKPEKGDIIYTREGAILGIAAVIDRDCNVALGQRSMLLSPDVHKCTPEFISTAMNCDTFLANALKGQSGSASPHINVGDIKAFKMIMPPMEQQKLFSSVVKQIDKSKATVQKALDETQLLFDSLMQKYFG